MKIHATLPVLLPALLISSAAPAWDCEHRREIEKTLDVSGSRALDVIAAAGDLEIRGREGLGEVRVDATVCASEGEWADETDVEVEAGDVATVAVRLPGRENGSSWFGNDYLTVDLSLEVPAGLALAVKDSSGDIVITGTGSVSVRDSSGDIELERIAGDVLLADSSGDIELRGVSGRVEVEQDSSGDIEGRDIGGGVLVARDSSGDIRFRDVRGDLIVERDSSGDIVASGVSGDFRVLRDGSGSIRHDGVEGEVQIPEKD
ncbi:MAG: DUF4097 family beta strand repeat-containing protein [Gammaproteobacteria bacterium]